MARPYSGIRVLSTICHLRPQAPRTTASRAPLRQGGGECADEDNQADCGGEHADEGRHHGIGTNRARRKYGAGRSDQEKRDGHQHAPYPPQLMTTRCAWWSKTSASVQPGDFLIPRIIWW